MIEEHDRVALTTKEPDAGLEPGDVGTIIHAYSGGEADSYSVEQDFWEWEEAETLKAHYQEVQAEWT